MENTINDCYVDVLGKKPSNEQINVIYNLLPQHIKDDANKWGWSDTVVGDNVCIWIRDNLDKINCLQYDELPKIMEFKELLKSNGYQVVTIDLSSTSTSYFNPLEVGLEMNLEGCWTFAHSKDLEWEQESFKTKAAAIAAGQKVYPCGFVVGQLKKTENKYRKYDVVNVEKLSFS